MHNLFFIQLINFKLKNVYLGKCIVKILILCYFNFIKCKNNIKLFKNKTNKND